MKNVRTISLGGNAFQLEEDAHEHLRRYLDDAGAALDGNPDKAEIVTDLEQAIAEKLSRFFSAHKTVANAEDVATVLKEMGPVEAQNTETGAPKQPASAPKRLYRIHEGAYISGVCMGLAAYLDVDVTLVRVVFIVLGIVTSGGFILAYIIMSFLIPPADTEAERAAAHGAPFTAQELVDRAKYEYANWTSRDWKSQKYEWKARMRTNHRLRRQNAHRNPVSPLLTIVNILLGIGLAIGIVTIFGAHTVFGIPLPATIPSWVAAIIFIVLYHIVTFPLRAARFAAHGYNYEEYYGIPGAGFYSIFEAFSWFGFFAVLVWLAYTFVPAAHHALDLVPPALARVGDWLNTHFFNQ